MNQILKQNKESKNARLEARITQAQKELLIEAASIQGRSLTDFIVDTVMETAKSVIQENRIMELSKRDSELFIANILDAPQPSVKLQEAGKEYLELMKKKNA